MARPTKYNKDFHPLSYIELSSVGKTRQQICVLWNVSADTLNRWSKDKKKPEFSEAIKRGNDYREAYYITILKKMALGEQKGCVRALIFLMKNTLKWK